MKKTLFMIAGFVTFHSYAQIKAGKIIYEEKVKLDIHLDEETAKMLMDSLPKQQSSKKTLYFNEELSLYEADDTPGGAAEVEKTSEGGRMKIKMEQPRHTAYFDLKNNKLTEQRDFMGRKFLIESVPDKSVWKLTGNQKMILTYPCQEAVKQEGDKKVVAWFAPSLPVTSGPAGVVGLPGMVLGVDVNEGKQTIAAVNIELKDIDKTLFVKPKEGKKVTKDEFKKIVDEKTKEMREENGGKGGDNVIIKINTR